MGPRDGGVVGEGVEEPERSEGAFVAGGEGMRRSEEAKVSEEAGRSPQSWWNATLHSGKKHQASEGGCGANPYDFFYFFLFFSCKNHLIQVKDSQ